VLFGNREIDLRGALALADQVPAIFRGCRFLIYVDAKTVPNSTIQKLEEKNAVIVKFDVNQMQSEGWQLTVDAYRVLRFLAIDRDDWDYILFRDLDSTIILREVAAVEEWLDSDLSFHIMRDHYYHYTPILAGMWGIKRSGKRLFEPSCAERLKAFLPKRQHHKTTDQQFLADDVFPRIVNYTMTHCPYYCKHPLWLTNISFGFPTRRYGGTHVAAFRSADNDAMDGGVKGMNTATVECRRNRAWIYG